MNFGSYETIFAISGMAMVAAGLIVPVRNSRDRLARFGVLGMGAGMIGYAFYVAGQTSGTFYFPLQLAALPWIILARSVYESRKTGKSWPNYGPTDGKTTSILLENLSGFSALRPEVLLRIAENTIHGLSEDGFELHAATIDRHSLTLKIRPTDNFYSGGIATRARGQILVLTGEIEVDGNGGYPISVNMIDEIQTTSSQTPTRPRLSGPPEVVGVRVYRKFLRSFAAALEAADPLSEIEFGNALLHDGIPEQAQSADGSRYALYKTSEDIESEIAKSLGQGVSVTELRETWDDWHDSGRVSDGQRLTAFRFLDDAEEW